ncbi:MAG: hypothetical protein LBE55_03330 [Clostridiales bacterium]|jgi:hypothetical protein|nr:hypothetical protein [Clostridiales bacterium]
MKKNYEAYDEGLENLYENLYDRAYDQTYAAMDLDERLADIQVSLDNICELLEGLVQSKKQKKEAGFKPMKIGADIGEEKSQMDIIAKIFGNKS